MARDAPIWFVMIGGKQAGPMSRVELGLELATGTIDGGSLIWKNGMQDWKPGSSIPELAALFEPEALEPSQPARTTARASARAAAGPRAKPVRIAPRTGAPATGPVPKQSARPAARTVTAPEAQQGHGRGMRELDTSSFRLSEVKADEGAAKKQMAEFDTAHFRLSDLPPKPAEAPKKALVEFDTAHFRLSDLPGKQQPDPRLTLDLNVRDFQEGVVGYADSGAAGPKAAARPVPPKPAPLAKAVAPRPAARPAVAAPPRGARAVTAMPALRPMRPAPRGRSAGTSTVLIGVIGGAAFAAIAVLWLLLK